MKQRMTLAEKNGLYAEHKRNHQATYNELAKWAAKKFKLETIPTKSAIGKAIQRGASQSQRLNLPNSKPNYSNGSYVARSLESASRVSSFASRPGQSPLVSICPLRNVPPTQKAGFISSSASMALPARFSMEKRRQPHAKLYDKAVKKS
ncbi:hypothetical protein H257_14877 [Aphanomyces astaci]|uniref:Uncharacterized protein n=1 Tax=Aphanomyces astaci TaxID=112090 RepID=W4FPX8_APHAT|nr:hypothetical protein H257_14877 [Aphanomyces astaci]ETV69515.1 hypothetical protein H257_14877 [Aphanomyces astaci]|eukprot:XP_009841088.1 hypothetical protein H257_14877 [Aphanomyces astaci]